MASTSSHKITNPLIIPTDIAGKKITEYFRNAGNNAQFSKMVTKIYSNIVKDTVKYPDTKTAFQKLKGLLVDDGRRINFSAINTFDIKWLADIHCVILYNPGEINQKNEPLTPFYIFLIRGINLVNKIYDFGQEFFNNYVRIVNNLNVTNIKQNYDQEVYNAANESKSNPEKIVMLNLSRVKPKKINIYTHAQIMDIYNSWFMAGSDKNVTFFVYKDIHNRGKNEGIWKEKKFNIKHILKYEGSFSVIFGMEESVYKKYEELNRESRSRKTEVYRNDSNETSGTSLQPRLNGLARTAEYFKANPSDLDTNNYDIGFKSQVIRYILDNNDPEDIPDEINAIATRLNINLRANPPALVHIDNINRGNQGNINRGRTNSPITRPPGRITSPPPNHNEFIKRESDQQNGQKPLPSLPPRPASPGKYQPGSNINPTIPRQRQQSPLPGRNFNNIQQSRQQSPGKYQSGPSRNPAIHGQRQQSPGPNRYSSGQMKHTGGHYSELSDITKELQYLVGGLFSDTD